MNRIAIFASLSTVLLLSSASAHAQEAPVPDAPTQTELPPAADVTPPVTKRPRDLVELDLRLGAGVRRFRGLDTRGVSVAAHLGASVQRLYFAANAGLGYERALTQGGLHVNVYSGEFNASFMLDRFRLGLVPGLAWYRVERATTGASVSKLMPSLGAEASFAVVKLDGAEFYLSVRGDLSPKATAAGASIGARF
jgi:hypothetical protein